MEKEVKKAVKPRVKKAVEPLAKKVEKKPIKVELSEKLKDVAVFIEETIKAERNKKLNTSACARLSKVKNDLLFVSKNIIK